MTDPATSTVPYLERSFRVRHYECDAYGHVNHANYLRYMQEAAFDASAAAGYDIARYEADGRQWLVRETDITYLRPLVYGDTVIVRTWVADFRRVRSRRAYALRLAGSDEPVATATTEWVLLDSATLRPDLTSDLRAVASSLNRYPNSTIEVIGHTDNTASQAYNQDLSQRRASAVANVLISSGVPAGRVAAYGRGEDQPIASNLTASGRAQNRRVEIIIRPTR